MFTPRCQSCQVKFIVDGTNLIVACNGQENERIRLFGVYSPSLMGTYRCDREGLLGYSALYFVQKWVPLNGWVAVYFLPERDVDGRRQGVAVRNGRELGGSLVAEGLALPWAGRGPKPNWCE